MKRQLLILVAFVMVTFMQAQVLSVGPAPEFSYDVAKQLNHKGVKANDGGVWWGYFVDGASLQSLGTSVAETFDCAIKIPANEESVGAGTIKAIRFYCLSSSNLSMTKVWISRSLPTDADAADYTQDVTVSSLKNGWNEITLGEPWEINNEEIYVGWSYTIKNVAYSIPVGGDYVANGTFIHSSQSVTEWQEIGDYGNLALQVLVEGGNFVDNSATPVDFHAAVVELGKTVSVPVTVKNNGITPITSLSYTIYDGTTTSAEKTVQTSSISYSGTGTVNFPFEASAEVSNQTRTLTITKVNGNDNISGSPSASGRIQTVAELKTWPRKTLIEEFTTEYCTWCPTAAQGLHDFLEAYPELAEQVAVVCHHAGYYTDWLTVSASSTYTKFYGSGGTYAPAFMYDRYAFDGKIPVESRQSTTAGYRGRVESRLSFPSYANVGLTATFNEEKKKINVSCDLERSWLFTDSPIKLTLFLTEDNITAKSQSGASGEFIHQHALRSVNSTWGATPTWQDDKASYTYTFTVNSAWKTDDLKVIAIISSYDSSDITNCVVENVACVVPTLPEGIEKVTNNNAAVVGRYTIDGRRTDKAQKGLNIIKMSDGSVRKVLVK